jgi:hypothetical protein
MKETYDEKRESLGREARIRMFEEYEKEVEPKSYLEMNHIQFLTDMLKHFEYEPGSFELFYVMNKHGKKTPKKIKFEAIIPDQWIPNL